MCSVVLHVCEPRGRARRGRPVFSCFCVSECFVRFKMYQSYKSPRARSPTTRTCCPGRDAHGSHIRCKKKNDLSHKLTHARPFGPSSPLTGLTVLLCSETQSAPAKLPATVLRDDLLASCRQGPARRGREDVSTRIEQRPCVWRHRRLRPRRPGQPALTCGGRPVETLRGPPAGRPRQFMPASSVTG